MTSKAAPAEFATHSPRVTAEQALRALLRLLERIHDGQVTTTPEQLALLHEALEGVMQIIVQEAQEESPDDD